MEIGKNRRNRAVRLTGEALLLVQRQLVDDWPSITSTRPCDFALITLTPTTMAEAVRVDGEILAAQGHIDEAIKRYNVALTLRNTFKALWGRSSLLIAIATAEQKLLRLNEAEQHLKEGLAGMYVAGDPAGLAEASRGLGSIAARRGQISAAREWFGIASRAISDRPREPMQVDLRARNAMLLSDEGKHEAALIELRECFE